MNWNSIKEGLILLARSRNFYICTLVLVGGIYLNLLSQAYLHQYINDGKMLPVLSDLILDNIPYWDVDYLYDIFPVIGVIILIIFIIDKELYTEVPYYLLIIGLFHVVRAIFIVLTPFGNPPMFDGTESIFEGFSNYEIGVYPSGHTGVSYLYFLISKGRYRLMLISCFIIIVAALFLSRGHYSIDILSGIFFAYAIKAFGDKHLKHRLL